MNNSKESSIQERMLTPHQLSAIKATEPLGATAVMVNDDNSTEPVILLDDIDGNRVWQPLHGKSPEAVLKLNEWYKHGAAMFKENKVPREFLEKMREVLLGISVLANFYEWSEEMVGGLVDAAVVKLAHERFCDDKKVTTPINELEHDDDFMPYIQMVSIYARSFTEIVQQVRDNAEQAKLDAKALQN